jgi:hypothetical protein
MEQEMMDQFDVAVLLAYRGARDLQLKGVALLEELETRNFDISRERLREAVKAAEKRLAESVRFDGLGAGDKFIDPNRFGTLVYTKTAPMSDGGFCRKCKSGEVGAVWTRGAVTVTTHFCPEQLVVPITEQEDTDAENIEGVRGK